MDKIVVPLILCRNQSNYLNLTITTSQVNLTNCNEINVKVIKLNNLKFIAAVLFMLLKKAF